VVPSSFAIPYFQLDTDIVEHRVFDNGTEWRVVLGVDISEYQESGSSVPLRCAAQTVQSLAIVNGSVEFDLISVEGTRHEARYPCCDYPVIDITYYLNIRRKKLFYQLP
jgi:hypothetical protein